MKILVDMNLSPRWIDFFADAGLTAVHWSSVGKGDATDADIMAHAHQEDQVVLTNDLDFSAILAATQGCKPSVVQIRSEDLSPSAIGGVIVRALRQMSTELEEGALLTIEPQRTRIRMLPLHR